ncbi:MAG TPA: addiction module protein [Verrucomicrobiae bacterium]|nr:addiction module protein [Verrucomicrobiae bacterium]
MSDVTETVCIEALSLPGDARAEIAHRLLMSLEKEDFGDGVSDLWRDEIERRRGHKKGAVPAAEAFRRAEADVE